MNYLRLFYKTSLVRAEIKYMVLSDGKKRGFGEPC